MIFKVFSSLHDSVILWFYDALRGGISTAPCARGCRAARWAARGAGGPSAWTSQEEVKAHCLEALQRHFPAPNFREFFCRGV